MTWVQIDDDYPDHPKVIGLSDAAFRLHVRALCYCNRHLTDGVPAVAFWKGNEEARDEFFGAGLLDHVRGVYRLHDFHLYQPSRAQILAKREKIHIARSAAGKTGAAKTNEIRWGVGKRSANGSAKRRPPSPSPSPPPPSLLPMEELFPRREDVAAENPAAPSPLFSEFIFQVAGKGDGSYAVPIPLLNDLVRLYPGVNVPHELRKAEAKTRTGAVSKKTAGGMAKFLHLWMERAQNSARSSGPSTAPQRTIPPHNPFSLRLAKDGASILYAGSWYSKHRDGKRWICRTEDGEMFRPDGTSTGAAPKDPKLNDEVNAAMETFTVRGFVE